MVALKLYVSSSETQSYPMSTSRWTTPSIVVNTDSTTYYVPLMDATNSSNGSTVESGNYRYTLGRLIVHGTVSGGYRACTGRTQYKFSQSVTIVFKATQTVSTVTAPGSTIPIFHNTYYARISAISLATGTLSKVTVGGTSIGNTVNTSFTVVKTVSQPGSYAELTTLSAVATVTNGGSKTVTTAKFTKSEQTKAISWTYTT